MSAKKLACPHCKTGELSPTKETHTDTSGAFVRVYACSNCEYTEGREEKA